MCRDFGINRIRLEFKERGVRPRATLEKRINRIRLEFKGGRGQTAERMETVLIESDWNLKYKAS